MIFRFWSSQYVQHLEAEIAWLRERTLAAEQKAAIAVAELVRLKTDGQANVHPRPLMPPHEPVDPMVEMQKLMQDSEFARAGE